MPTNVTRRIKQTDSRLRLSLQYAAARDGVPWPKTFRRWAVAALRRPADVTIRVVAQREGRTLNHRFRRKDYATNVLSFVYDEVLPRSGRVHGDIVLCAPVIAREAKQQRKRLTAHYAHLTVHGLLHLQGYDHMRSADARVMERVEIEILRDLGYANPYAD